MKNIKSNCHTHTNLCDGKNTAREMIEGAIEKGFTTLGFSGHVPMNFPNDWAMSAEKLEKYYNEITYLKDVYSDKIEILCGIELDSDYELLKEYKFDYILSSVHQLHGKGGIYAIDLSPGELTECVNTEYGGNWYKMAEDYFESLARFAVEADTDIVGHYDLITKFNKGGRLFDEANSYYQANAIRWLDYIIDNKPEAVFEINTGAMFRCGNEAPYPADFILKRIGERGARVTVTSDAHCIEALDFMFDKAKDYCKACGIGEIWHLTGKGFVSEKL